MTKNLIEELRWRGLLHDMIPDTEEYLLENKTSGYIGFDPTSDSLHIGSMVQIFLLMHLQRAGHRPIALMGGATGMIGDPSGKSAERNLLSPEEIERNIAGIAKQLSKFIDFGDGPSDALLVNNYDWMKDYSFINFIRDVGKHITVNYMMAKDSVKKRIETGISFTEFSYQMLQGYDFLHLYRSHNCRLQMGGSDQWGNITTGTELIRRIDEGKAFAVVSPLVTKADGGKFGKTEEGNVWLDPERTSPYKFYQFWINSSDEDAENYIKIFTFKEREEVESLIEQHRAEPHRRILQQALAEDITVRAHSREDYERAVAASQILFGRATKDELSKLSERDILEVFDGVPQVNIAVDQLSNGVDIIEFLTDATGGLLASKGEARRALKENSISINKEKIGEDYSVSTDDLLNGKYIIAQRGKKNYFLVKAV